MIKEVGVEDFSIVEFLDKNISPILSKVTSFDSKNSNSKSCQEVQKSIFILKSELSTFSNDLIKESENHSIELPKKISSFYNEINLNIEKLKQIERLEKIKKETDSICKHLFSISQSLRFSETGFIIFSLIRLASNYLTYLNHVEDLCEKIKFQIDQNSLEAVIPNFLSLLPSFRSISLYNNYNITIILKQRIFSIFNIINYNLLTITVKILNQLGWPRKPNDNLIVLPSEFNEDLETNKQYSQLIVLLDSICYVQFLYYDSGEIFQFSENGKILLSDYIDNYSQKYFVEDLFIENLHPKFKKNKILKQNETDKNKKSEVFMDNNELYDLFTAGLDVDEQIQVETEKNEKRDDNFMKFPQLWILFLLFSPIAQRFDFHFINSSRKTNRIDKPEWAITFLLHTIQDHLAFLNNIIQPIIDKYYNNFEIKDAFINLIVLLLSYKLKSELNKYNNANFRHVIDELLIFTRLLYNDYDYNHHCVNTFSLIYNNFERIINLEKENIESKLSSLFQMKNSWITLSEGKCSIPPVVLAFNSLIQRLSNRFSCYQYMKHQNEYFDDILIKTINNFINYIDNEFKNQAIILSKDINNLNNWISFCSLLNSLQYLNSQLNNIGEEKLYIYIYYYKQQFINENMIYYDLLTSNCNDISLQGSLFDIQFEKLKKLKDNFISILVGILFTTFDTGSYKYQTSSFLYNDTYESTISASSNIVSNEVKKDTDNKEEIYNDLSYSLCNTFSLLQSQLININKYCYDNTFNTIWKRLTHKIDNLIFNSIILKNYFNRNGINQLIFDMKALFLIFSPYCEEPNKYFQKISESLAIYSMSNGQFDELKSIIKSSSLSQWKLKHLIFNIKNDEIIKMMSLILYE